MACASCASNSACLCSVVAGSHVSVSGTGSGADPYIVSATSCVSTNAGNSLTLGTDGCPFFAETPFAGVAGNGIAIVANGTAGHAPVISVCLSTAAGNTIVFGADNCLYAPASPIVCEDIQDCVSPMMLNNGFFYDDANNRWATIGTPGQVLTADGVGNGFWSTGTGAAETPAGVAYPDTDADGIPEIGVRYDGANGSTTPTFDAATGEWVICSPAGGGVPGAASQFTTDWPCADTFGTKIYQTATGLRGVPEHTSRIASTIATLGAPGGVNSGGTNNWGDNESGLGVSPPQYVFTNPSTCRSMNWYYTMRATIFWSGPGVGGAAIDGFTGGLRFPLASVYGDGPSATFPLTESNHYTAITNGVLAPGAAIVNNNFNSVVGNGINGNFFATRSMSAQFASISGAVQDHVIGVTI